MEVIYGISKIKKYPRPVVALGVFDGVHLGHRKILKEAVSKAKGINGTSVVLTFWPHPQREESLYSLEHRLRLINEIGINVCIVINFNTRFAKISAFDFIKDILVNKICAQYIFVGKNFRFGKNAEGDFKTLNKTSKIYSFRVKVFKVISIDNKPISSTLIRTLIKRGDLTKAQKLLGRPVSILGTVIKGAALGKRLGFPTANIDPHHEVIPQEGVYAVKVFLNGNKYKGACYIGPKPFLNKRSNNIEVHIFNFKKNIYGKYLEIQFCKRIRKKKEFSSMHNLANQIKEDVKIVKDYFSLH